MSVLSTSNRKTIVLSIASQPALARPSVLLPFAEQLLRDLGDALGLEPVFSQQLLERGRRAKCLHADDARSEEHTSELQSRQYLVCRLLLEKKQNDRPVADHSSTSDRAGA